MLVKKGAPVLEVIGCCSQEYTEGLLPRFRELRLLEAQEAPAVP